MRRIALLTMTALLVCMSVVGGYLVYVPRTASVFAAGGARIVLDAGHGQPDGGAVGSALGVIEEQINLSIAQKLRILLEEDGWQVVMTREDAGQIGADKNADMRRRREIIASAGQRLTVSIHQNSYTADHTVSGPQVFYAPGSVEGKKLAEQLQTALNYALAPAVSRIAAEGDYYIVKSGSAPSVIVECGFLSNAAEERLLLQSQYQVKIARAIADGIAAYCAR